MDPVYRRLAFPRCRPAAQVAREMRDLLSQLQPPPPPFECPPCSSNTLTNGIRVEVHRWGFP